MIIPIDGSCCQNFASEMSDDYINDELYVGSVLCMEHCIYNLGYDAPNVCVICNYKEQLRKKKIESI